MNRYIVGYKNDEFYMISSLNVDVIFVEEVKKFNEGINYRYEERLSKLDINNFLKELIKT